jgi:hypothetical protein
MQFLALLLEPERTIGAVARQVGYSSAPSRSARRSNVSGE